jgi:SAM-dependent methyltransferase
VADIELKLACPICRSSLQSINVDEQCCPSDGTVYQRRAGIWRFLLPEDAAQLQEFSADYLTVRRAEGWGADQAEYYRSLPQVANDHPQHAIWQIRAQNFERLIALIGSSASLKVLDIGAGNGWLSNQLATRGHIVAALDILDDQLDGLGAKANYNSHFDAYQANFDRLPFEADQFDWVIFNAAAHYTSDLHKTLLEAQRVLKERGQLAIMDSPFYSNANSGRQMIAAREVQFVQRYGFDRELSAIGFLTWPIVSGAANEVGLIVSQSIALENFGQRLRRTWTRLRLKREGARFPLIVLEKSHEPSFYL